MSIQKMRKCALTADARGADKALFLALAHSKSSGDRRSCQSLTIKRTLEIIDAVEKVAPTKKKKEIAADEKEGLFQTKWNCQDKTAKRCQLQLCT